MTDAQQTDLEAPNDPNAPHPGPAYSDKSIKAHDAEEAPRVKAAAEAPPVAAAAEKTTSAVDTKADEA